MGNIDRYDIIMNPALGSIAISSFVKGYTKNNQNVPFFLCFFVIPMVFQKEIRSTILTTNSFKNMVITLSKNHKERLYNINRSIKQIRDLSFKSFLISISTDFISVDSSANIILNKPMEIPQMFSNNILLKDIIKSSEKLGIEFSKNTILDIVRFLNVGV